MNKLKKTKVPVKTLMDHYRKVQALFDYPKNRPNPLRKPFNLTEWMENYMPEGGEYDE